MLIDVSRSTSHQPPWPVAYLVAIAAVVAATVVTYEFQRWLEPSVSLLFFPAILLTSIYFGLGAGLAAAFLSTASLAYFLIPPLFSFDIGFDDIARLAVFGAVAIATASISGARRRAEDAQRRSVDRLQETVATLQRLTGWPVLIGADMASGVSTIVSHAASVVGAAVVVVAWETDDEPWVCVASSDREETRPAIAKYSAAEMTPIAPQPVHPRIAELIGGRAVTSAAFRSEHLAGRVFFGGLSTGGQEALSILEIVAREVGSSLDQLHVAAQLKLLAIREDRIRLARDLHDGILQALTGIRMELQSLAHESPSGSTDASDRLFAVERALSAEQRQLRLFIEDLKPALPLAESGRFADRISAMCQRLSAEWRTPIAVRVEPPALALPVSIEHAVRLMVHEAAANALKHASATQLDIEVVGADGELRIITRDDGRGFGFRGRLDHDTLASSNVGPISLRERVDAMGGRIVLDSTERGSRVEITLPVAAVVR
jgi:signal transduction histidine kinase